MSDELHPEDSAEHANSSEGAAMFKDPICDMDVEPATAAGSYEYKGTTYYFCCEACLEKFRESPEDYLGAAKAQSKSAEAIPGAEVVDIGAPVVWE